MKNNLRRYFEVTLLLLLGLFLLTACQLKNTPQETQVVDTPAIQIQTASPTAEKNEYPSTPEEVIRAFLIAYPSDQVYAIQFLSPSFVSTLNATSAAKLLPASGDITGFIIEKGSTSAEAEQSEILTNIAFENMSSQVQFNLEIVDGRWVIYQIAAK